MNQKINPWIVFTNGDFENGKSRTEQRKTAKLQNKNWREMQWSTVGTNWLQQQSQVPSILVDKR